MRYGWLDFLPVVELLLTLTLFDLKLLPLLPLSRPRPRRLQAALLLLHAKLQLILLLLAQHLLLAHRPRARLFRTPCRAREQNRQ